MKRLLPALLPLLLAACATRAEMRSLPSDAGTKGVYAATFEKVRLAAQDSTGELGFKIKEQYGTDDHTYIASQGLSTGTSGRYVRVRVVKGDEIAVYVAVRSKAESREAMQTDELIEKDVHKRIAARLAAK
jgi:hypothetical protein